MATLSSSNLSCNPVFNLSTTTPYTPSSLALPAFRKSHISCSAIREPHLQNVVAPQIASASFFASLVASQPAFALVDDRLSTEGTGLSLGVSNPLLIWILLGVSTLIWSLFFVYSSSLPEGDDDSGLSL